MRPALFLLASSVLLVTSARAQSTENATTANKDDCSIAGLVIKLAGSEPLKGARVLLRSMDDQGRSLSTVTTDSGGHFELRGLPAGRYHLQVTRTGFVAQVYGQRTPNAPGAILTLAPGQNMKDLVFRLIPSAIISGRIENEDGEPLSWAPVSALRLVYADGIRTLSPEETVHTNDRGEYRLFGLSPGRYFLTATYHAGAHPGGQGEEGEILSVDSGSADYVRTYYPGSPDPSKAEAITVKAGEEIPSMDLLLRPVAVYHVRGHVNNLIATASKHSRVSTMVQLQPKKVGLFYNSYTVGQNNTVDTDGNFDVPGVLPGSYTLFALWFYESRGHRAVQNIEVGNADVEGVQLTIAPGLTVSGRLHWDSNPTVAQEQLFLMANSVDDEPMPGSHARVAPDGSFTLNDVPDVPLRMEVYGQPEDCYLKAVTYGGVDSMEDGFTAHAGIAATLDITLSSRGAHVQGSVTDADGLPAVGVWVVLVPDGSDGKLRARRNLYKAAQTDQHGQFVFRGISPGDYKLFSWEEVEDGAWQDPEFLKPFQEKAEKVAVKEGEIKSVRVTVIRTAGTEEQKP